MSLYHAKGLKRRRAMGHGGEWLSLYQAKKSNNAGGSLSSVVVIVVVRSDDSDGI